jgi:serine phosphatase RsbU (regulator of sigma subunit)
MLQELYASVKAFTVGAAQNDDVTALVVRYEGSKS